MIKKGPSHMIRSDPKAGPILFLHRTAGLAEYPARECTHYPRRAG